MHHLNSIDYKKYNTDKMHLMKEKHNGCGLLSWVVILHACNICDKMSPLDDIQVKWHIYYINIRIHSQKGTKKYECDLKSMYSLRLSFLKIDYMFP